MCEQSVAAVTVQRDRKAGRHVNAALEPPASGAGGGGSSTRVSSEPRRRSSSAADARRSGGAVQSRVLVFVWVENEQVRVRVVEKKVRRTGRCCTLERRKNLLLCI